MNKLILILFAFLPLSLLSQNIGIHTTTPDPSAALDVVSTNSGVLIPRMTLFQRDMISNPATGLLVFQTDYNPGFYFYEGTKWLPFSTLGMNGLSLNTTTKRLHLGGPLIENTLINNGAFDKVHNLNGTGNFEVRENSTPFFFAGNNGRVGIGTAAPEEQLHTTGNIRTDSRTILLGANQSIYGNDASAFYFDGNHASVTQLILRDQTNTTFGRLYGSGNGRYFGLLDGDANWSYIIDKDVYTGFRIDNSEKMRILANGHVGIGTSTPAGKLTVMVDSAARGFEVYSDYGSTHIPYSNGWSYLAGQGIIFRTTASNTERARITPTGFMGVGITTPAQRIHTSGNIRADGRTLFLGANQSIYGNNSSGINMNMNHSTIVRLGMRDKENTHYGSLYGSSNGLNFGLLDGDANWAVRVIKDTDTRLYINNIEKYRFTPKSIEFYNFVGNISLGNGTLNAITTGGQNVGIGTQALQKTTTPFYNIGIGFYTLGENVTGSANTGVGGFNVLAANTSGSYNTAVGGGAMGLNTTGENNAGVGAYAISSNTTGNFNTAMGYSAGGLTTTQSNNTAIGAYSGRQLVGEDNTCLGSNSGNTVGTATLFFNGSTAVGSYANITASNQFRVGHVFTNSIGGFRAWTNLSDGQFKTNVQENVPGLDFIMKLRPVTYKFDTNKLKTVSGMNSIVANSENLQEAERLVHQQTETGFVAQEVEIAANALNYSFSGVDAPKNGADHYGLRYSTFVVPLVQGMQEQQKIIEDQANRIKSLEKTNEQILKEMAEIRKLIKENQ